MSPTHSATPMTTEAMEELIRRLNPHATSTIREKLVNSFSLVLVHTRDQLLSYKYMDIGAVNAIETFVQERGLRLRARTEHPRLYVQNERGGSMLAPADLLHARIIGDQLIVEPMKELTWIYNRRLMTTISDFLGPIQTIEAVLRKVDDRGFGLINRDVAIQLQNRAKAWAGR